MLSNKVLVSTCAIVFCCNLVLLVLFGKYSAGDKCYVTVNEHKQVAIHLPDDFLSIGIDTSELQNHNIDFSKPLFVELTKTLSPARLRLGGTMSDRLIFKRDSSAISCEHCHKDAHHKWKYCPVVCKHKSLPFFIMSGNEWSEINEFCKAANVKLLFSLNVLLRDDHGWNEDNAKEIIEYSKELGFHHIDWQLGNEPNSFHHVFNVTVSPQMLSNDFKKLKKLLNHSGYKHSLLVGPDTTRPQPNRPECLEYMQEFLANGSNNVNVRSWHQYYLNSRTATLEDFWNPNTFDLLKQQIVTMKNHTKKYHRIPMWLTETSTSYGRGAPGLSNSYAGSPLWVDKLGLSAKHGITTVIRQSLYGGNYSLIDKNLNPLPDWWLSVLYKKVVGNKVLHVQCRCSRYQRMYAHCANRKYTNDTSAITIFAVNLEMAKARFLLNGTAFHSNNFIIDEYIISAPSNDRTTKTVLLNGWPLHYKSGIEDLQPQYRKYGNHISMPPYSIGFWVIKNTSIKACE